MKEYDAYLFDADGTILDTRELIERSFLHMGAEIGLEIPLELIHNTIGLPVMAQMRMMLGDDRPEEDILRAREIYNGYMMSHLDEFLGAFPGAADTVGELDRRGKKLAVVTSRRLPTTGPFLERVGLRRFFSLLVTPESTEKHKPDPAPAIFAMEKLGAKPETTVFIGDAIFDIQCGSAAGTDTAFVAWGGMDPSLWSPQPTWRVERFEELLPDEE